MAIIDKPSDYFETKLWAGNGSSQNITGLDFQPDWVWIKSRTDTRKHNVYDSVRGVQKRIVPNSSVAEDTASGLTAFGTNGFTVGSETDTNGSGRNFVGWSWKAGTSFTNDASATGIGTIDSTGSVNTDAGFSIISWTGDGNNGATIAHGLGVTPAIVITKRRSAVGDWLVGGSTINTVGGGSNKLLLLNTTAAIDTNSEVYQTFSSTTFQVGVNAYANTNGSTMISYCFADVQGYSKFGSYTGNGSADGTFVYLGFKPAFVIIKRSDGAANWELYDSKRLGYNSSNPPLYPDLGNAEGDNGRVDILSNGFKIVTTSGNLGASGGTYIYMCFASEPLVGDNPATAR